MDFDAIVAGMADLDSVPVIAGIEAVMAAGGGDAAKALDALQAGMEGVGDRFESGEYFLSDLLYAADLMNDAVGMLKPALASVNASRAGRLILATVKGDLHDIGKNIVRGMLEAGGFEVIDMGIDVPAEKIVERAKQESIGIVALSGVLTLAIESMKNVVAAFEEAGMRDGVKILIGGNPVTAEACRAVGADAWTRSPQEGVNICKAWRA